MQRSGSQGVALRQYFGRDKPASVDTGSHVEAGALPPGRPACPMEGGNPRSSVAAISELSTFLSHAHSAQLCYSSKFREPQSQQISPSVCP